MVAAYIQVAPDSTGKKVQAFENSISGNTVEAQAMVMVDSAGLEKTVQIIQGLQSANTTGSITGAASVVGPLAVSGLNVLTVVIFGTYTGVSCIFEASPDNANWFTVQGSRVDNGVLVTGLTVASSTVMAVDIPIGAFTHFRVRATAWASGTASVVMAAQSMPYDPCPATIPQQPTASLLNATVTPIAITKATQGTTGFTTQDLKDAGRAIVNAATAIAGVTAVTTEALLSLNVSRDGAATSALTTITVTSGKRYRVTGIIAGIRSTGATVLSGRISLRFNPSGAATATSPIVAIIPLASGAALAEAGNQLAVMFPDGIEFSGTNQIGLSQVCSAITGSVYASLIGYEY